MGAHARKDPRPLRGTVKPATMPQAKANRVMQDRVDTAIQYAGQYEGDAILADETDQDERRCTRAQGYRTAKGEREMYVAQVMHPDDDDAGGNVDLVVLSERNIDMLVSVLRKMGKV